MVQESKQQNTTGTVETVEERGETSTSPKCTFFGVVPIDIQRFLESGVTVVECPGCACTRTLEPRRGGVLLAALALSENVRARGFSITRADMTPVIRFHRHLEGERYDTDRTRLCTC